MHGHDVHEVLAAVRVACPHIPCGVSTGAWIVPDPNERLAQVTAWHTLPDYASVNFDEIGAVEIAAALHERGVGIEAGLNGPAATEVFLGCGLADWCLRILLEPPEETITDALANVASMESMLDRAAVQRPRLLHGTGPTAWTLLQRAGECGYAARIGFEDTLRLPDGSLAADNAALVRAARALLALPAAGR